MPKTSKEIMRMIKQEEDPEMKPLSSDADGEELKVGSIDPDKFMKTAHTARRLTQGKELKKPVPSPMGIVKVPAYKNSLVKEYESLPRYFKKRALAMFAAGSSEAEIQARFGIAKRTWEEWIGKYPDFAEFVSVGLTRSQAWWEDQARNYVNQSSAKFNAALWFMNMKNRFGYKDSRDVNVKEQTLIGFTLLPPMEKDPRMIESGESNDDDGQDENQ